MIVFIVPGALPGVLCQNFGPSRNTSARSHVLRIETKIHFLHPDEAVDQQTRAHQQDHAQRDFGN